MVLYTREAGSGSISRSVLAAAWEVFNAQMKAGACLPDGRELVPTRDSGNFFFYKKKSPLLWLSYLFFSSKVTHTRSIHKYAQSVMLTHYSSHEGLTPICHTWSQTEPNSKIRYVCKSVCPKGQLCKKKNLVSFTLPERRGSEWKMWP